MAQDKSATNTTNEIVYWMNDVELEALVSQARGKNMSLDEACDKIAEAGYAIGDKQVNIKKFVAKWHGQDTIKAIKSFF